MFPEAERILRSFGGLRFGDRNQHVLIDPVAAIEQDEGLTERCEAAVGLRLYPIGYQEHQDREAVFVDEAGRVYINFGDGNGNRDAASFSVWGWRQGRERS